MKQYRQSRPFNWPIVLDRLEWLLLLAMVAAAVLVYPLRLQDAWLGRLNDWWEEGATFWARWTAGQLREFLSFYYSPLILKGVLAAVFMLMFMGVRLARPLLGYPWKPSPAGRWGWMTVAAFFGYSIVSGLWSPTPVIAREVAWWAFVYGAFLYLLLRRGVSVAEMRQLAMFIMVLGLIVTAVGMMQSLPIFGDWIFQFMYKFPDKRNIYGSLIGHNTGAASFMMITAFVALAALLGAKTEPRRAFAAVYLVLAIFMMLILQSRAIWLLAPPLGLISAWTLMRRAGMRRVPPLVWGMLAIAVIGVASQMFPNPLYRENNPIGRRMKDLKPESLLGESRLRLNVIGWPIVMKKPVFGHGLFAFQYVYPPYQGRYFITHPNSRLNQTTMRSNMAHNEYLQEAIDGGFVGLLLMLLVMGEAARRGLRRRDVGLSDSDALMHRAFGWAALGLAIHSFVDFPLHIPPLAVTGMMCMAAWASLRKDEEQEKCGAGAPAGRSIEKANTPRGTKLQKAHAKPAWELIPLLRLLGVGALVAAVPIFARPFFLKLEADGLSNLSNGYAVGAQANVPPPMRLKMLGNAIDYGTTAAALHPDDYLTRNQLADAYLQRGALLGQGSLMAEPSERSQLHEQAVSDLNKAINNYNRSGEGLQFHYLYWRRAQAHRQLGYLTRNPAEINAYLADLELALSYCPAFIPAASELAEALDAQNRPEAAERAIQLKRNMMRHAPTEFDNMYVLPAYRAVRQQRYSEGLARWEKIVPVDPGRKEWLVSLIVALTYAGDHERALELIKPMRSDEKNYYGSGIYYYDGILTRDWPKLVKELVIHAQAPNKKLEDVIEYHIVEQEALARAGMTGPDRFPKPASMKLDEWDIAVAERRPGLLLYLFYDAQKSRQAVDARLAMGGRISFGFWADAYYIGRASNDSGLVSRALEAMKNIDPKHPTYQVLARESAVK